MSTFFRVYSIIFMSIIMANYLYTAFKTIRKDEYWQYILALFVIMPVWWYIIFFSIAI